MSGLANAVRSFLSVVVTVPLWMLVGSMAAGLLVGSIAGTVVGFALGRLV